MAVVAVGLVAEAVVAVEEVDLAIDAVVVGMTAEVIVVDSAAATEEVVVAVIAMVVAVGVEMPVLAIGLVHFRIVPTQTSPGEIHVTVVGSLSLEEAAAVVVVDMEVVVEEAQ